MESNNNKDHHRSIKSSISTPDLHDTGLKLERAREAYAGYNSDVMEKPSKVEVWIWYLYEVCSYFIHSCLLPIVFPLMISQIHRLPAEPARGWLTSPIALSCRPQQSQLYEALVNKNVEFGTARISALQWTSFSWGVGLGLAGPILWLISTSLDYGNFQPIIAGTAIATGFFFCLPTGFFNVTWIFPPFIIAIVAASTIAAATHTRHHGMMVRGFTGPNLHKSRFALRRWLSSWLSLYAAAAGALGSAAITAFTYYMLRKKEKELSLWIVTIFSGLTWAAGISHVAFIKPGSGDVATRPSPAKHSLSIFTYPHAFTTLILTFLSSFTTMCIFASGYLYFAGFLCLRPPVILYSWLIYFVFPLISLPAVHLVQHALRADAAKMHALGFVMALITSGFGFYFRSGIWAAGVILAFSAVQGTSAGVMHAFQRVLLSDCSPPGKEGVFGAWFEWWRAAGAFAGFTVAATSPGEISISLAVTFLTSVAGIVVLVYGHISDTGGAAAAGHVVAGEGKSGRVYDEEQQDDPDGGISSPPSPRARLALEDDVHHGNGKNYSNNVRSLAVMKEDEDHDDELSFQHDHDHEDVISLS
ncbi:unnamed protein product [Linum tenue]|uniref:Uncharacterized protein n=2 Tax=Linum tenue TaxID=586396 RepID=A0AAV0KCF7_9ROSI|nr:unnamed protein product [Linum tenue]